MMDAFWTFAVPLGDGDAAAERECAYRQADNGIEHGIRDDMWKRRGFGPVYRLDRPPLATELQALTALGLATRLSH